MGYNSSFLSRKSGVDILSDDTIDTLERHHEFSVEDDQDSVFKTCMSGKTETRSLSSLRTQAKHAVSRKLTWDRYCDPARPTSCSDLTEGPSDRSGSSDLRSLPQFFSGESEPSAPADTPMRNRAREAMEWAAARYLAAEELEARLAGGVTFVPELRAQESERSRATELSRGAAGDVECTFHPRVSPNSSALFRRAAKERGEDELSVFERLFPHQAKGREENEKGKEEEEEEEEEGEQQRGRREHTAAEEREALARVEREKLRERCGALTVAQAGGETFELFLYNILSAANDPPPFVRTAYRSSAATITKNTPEAKRKKSQRLRLTQFHEFLSRQSDHMTNRMRSLRELEDALTPSFKPAITETSAEIAKELLARTGATQDSASPATLSSAVKKHRTPYVDECTFKPKITPVSSAMAPRGVQSMMLDSARLRKMRESAREEAKAKEPEYPFRPALNDERNARVESLLHPKNYARYGEYLCRRKVQLAETKREMDAKQESESKADCTFRPKVTRPPAYIARMASSFALVRQQYGEL